MARSDNAQANRIVSSAFRLIAALTIPAGGPKRSGRAYHAMVLSAQPEDALAAGPVLQLLGIALIFICLMTLTNVIPQTYGAADHPHPHRHRRRR